VLLDDCETAALDVEHALKIGLISAFQRESQTRLSDKQRAGLYPPPGVSEARPDAICHLAYIRVTGRSKKVRVLNGNVLTSHGAHMREALLTSADKCPLHVGSNFTSADWFDLLLVEPRCAR